MPAVIGLIAVLALAACASKASYEALKYSPNDKKQHCFATCKMKINCGGKLPAAALATGKEVLDLTRELTKRELGIINRVQYNHRVEDSIKDFYADMKCIDSKTDKECCCCCKDA